MGVWDHSLKRDIWQHQFKSIRKHTYDIDDNNDSEDIDDNDDNDDSDDNDDDKDDDDDDNDEPYYPKWGYRIIH